MIDTLMETHFQFPGQVGVYKGKVREVYTLQNDILVMVATDRLSAFDVVMPRGIPFKGQILNQIASKMMKATEDLVPNWLMANPDPNVAVGMACTPFKVEMVIRGYMAGHASREYASGKRELCGVSLPEGLKTNDPFPEPIITPATKAEKGDEDYAQLEDYTHKLFRKGTELAAERGLILVDTKYEFGKDRDGKIRLIDEIHTPDSSRYFYSDGYEERQERGEAQKQLSKEFVRQWLISNGFQGLDGQVLPQMNDEYILSVSDRYIELYEHITGETFIKAETAQIESRIDQNVRQYLNSVSLSK
ncbi:phosphoribosylaminoimidazolesuccinocarboxamide synthase [uncultured Eudoraea sp.]|uniref:phosphoribosylaminoimidazolesuccinocarboxamide synthase n=1 Tax=uncultured Eudoraea sp. TaxID=1035614 RepID=UPI0026091393|nr:phosphoribosylaminoimidazolesuccinocarboxamide synthase [uncultured Eudoraea sp.]